MGISTVASHTSLEYNAGEFSAEKRRTENRKSAARIPAGFPNLHRLSDFNWVCPSGRRRAVRLPNEQPGMIDWLLLTKVYARSAMLCLGHSTPCTSIPRIAAIRSHWTT